MILPDYPFMVNLVLLSNDSTPPKIIVIFFLLLFFLQFISCFPPKSLLWILLFQNIENILTPKNISHYLHTSRGNIFSNLHCFIPWKHFPIPTYTLQQFYFRSFNPWDVLANTHLTFCVEARIENIHNFWAVVILWCINIAPGIALGLVYELPYIIRQLKWSDWKLFHFQHQRNTLFYYSHNTITITESLRSIFMNLKSYNSIT